MIDLLSLSIAVGLAVSLLFSEVFGLAAGGMVVPGYIALNLGNPVDVGLTLLAGFATYVLVHSLSTVLVIYGKRRTTIMILVGYLIGAFLRNFFAQASVFPPDSEYHVIGYIIPGLIAIWFDRQGTAETVCALLIASVVVRLILVLLVGTELQVL
jgi:gamma-polyglutamate biosynthesis protein CapC